jgi:hypothetical protein
MQYVDSGEKQLQLFNAHQPLIPHYKNFNLLKKRINMGYSVINSAKSVYVHTAGRLFLDKRDFHVERSHFVWEENSMAAVEWVKPIIEQQVAVEHLPNIKFIRFSWQNGSEAILDSRGLLHLKSVDASIPEICILLVVDKPTACWSADGIVSGPGYFTARTEAPQMEPSVFYKNYVRRFIEALK